MTGGRRRALAHPDGPADADGARSGAGSPADGSGAMFDAIAPRYDLLNRLMSLGLDRWWRRQLVRALTADAVDGRRRVLDLATGTADVALAVARRDLRARVVGLDPSGGMLEVGQRKLGRAGVADRVSLTVGDAQWLPFDDDGFDASCVSFGIRNVPDRDLALREMRRVTRPGGVVAILELAEPRGGLLAPFARLHVHHVVPLMGALLSGADAYRYLKTSVAAFPPADVFAASMTASGLTNVKARRLGFGAAHLYTARSC